MTDAPLLRVALGQLEPGPDIDKNLAAVTTLAAHARDQDARWLLLPEYATFLHGSRKEMERAASQSDRIVRHVCELASTTHMWILLGSVVVPLGGGTMANRSLLVNAEGRVAASYDKLHMFDVTLPDGRKVMESKAYAAGHEAVVVTTPFGRVGMSICYDLRFPQLYRAMSHAGADILLVPSAFARSTGNAHWRQLLVARAIENGAYVLAPATCGESPGGRPTHGHSLAVDPWGAVVGELNDEPGCLIADLSLERVAGARSHLPTLTHDRAFAVRAVEAL
jgi:predicted amidohydrolase